jgi:hypothetical protein
LDALALSAWRTIGRWRGAYQSTPDFVEQLVFREPGRAYQICRVISAICGIATVLATYYAAMWGCGRRSTALLAALLIALNFLHARDSHYATVDVPLTLMVTMALGFALKAAVTETRRDVLLSAGFAGLAASAKFNGAIVVASTVVAAARRFFEPSSTTRPVPHRPDPCLGRGRHDRGVRPDVAVVHSLLQDGASRLRIQSRVLFSTPGRAPESCSSRARCPPRSGGRVHPGARRTRARDLEAPVLRPRALAVIIPAFASMARLPGCCRAIPFR